MRRAIRVCLLVVGLILSFSMVDARSSDVVPMKGQSTSWDKKISGATRFKLVLGGQAILDRETGLVWARHFLDTENEENNTVNWEDAITKCYQKEVGGRYGWRLPTIVELATLLEKQEMESCWMPVAIRNLTDSACGSFWSCTPSLYQSDEAWYISFVHTEAFDSIWPHTAKKDTKKYSWCVRGGN